LISPVADFCVYQLKKMPRVLRLGHMAFADETPKVTGPHRRFTKFGEIHPLNMYAGFLLLALVVGALIYVLFWL